MKKFILWHAEEVHPTFHLLNGNSVEEALQTFYPPDASIWLDQIVQGDAGGMWTLGDDTIFELASAIPKRSSS